MKDWVIIIGTLLILIIVIDGIRRKRNERYGAIKVSRSLKKRAKQADYEEEIPLETPSYTSELPNGGARVVAKRDPNVAVPSIEKKATAKSYVEKQNRQEQLHTEVTRRNLREPEQTSLNLGQSVPILMESVQDAQARQTDRHEVDDLLDQERIEPSFSASRNDELDENYPPEDDEYEGEDFEEDDHPYEEEVEEEYEESEQDPEDDEFVDDEYSHEEDYDDEPQTTTTSQQQLAAEQPAEPEEVLIINVMAFKGEMFNGGDLLDIVLKCGMRYGSMDIFHRYSDAKGEGTLLFSMANMVKPGTFDLDAMDEFETPGVSLFMTLPLNADSMQSFDLMLDTAKAIAETLDGELKDEQRSVMTRQTVEHCRQRIRDYERKRLFRRPR